MDSVSSTKTLVKNRTIRSRHGSLKGGNSSATRRPPSPDSACEHDGEWIMGPISGPDDMTSDLSEEGGEKSCGMVVGNASSVDRRKSEAALTKGAAGQDSDVDSGIVACRKLGERIGSTSSADTDSSQESRSRNEYSPPFQKNELSKSRSYTGSLRIPRRSSCLASSGPVKGDHLALKECNRRPPTPLSVFPDSHHCVRFDEQLQLSEQNIRRSCRKLFATLYAQRFSYPSHQDNSSLHDHNNSLASRIRSRTVPELELRRYSPVSSDLHLKHIKTHKENVSPEEIKKSGSTWSSHRAVHKSMSDASIGGKISPSSHIHRYKSQYHHNYPMDFSENKIAHTTSTDSGLGSLRNSSQCTCYIRQTNSTCSSHSTSVPTCTCRCCNCNQQFFVTVESPPKLFKSSSCSTLSSALSHQSRPQLTQFPPRTMRKAMSQNEDKSKIKLLQKHSSCSNLLDKPSNGFHIANVPVYNDNMVQAYAHIASVIPEDLKSNCSSQGGRRAKTLNRLRYTTDNVFTDPHRSLNTSFSSTPESFRCLGRKDLLENTIYPVEVSTDCVSTLSNIATAPQSTGITSPEVDAADIYSQITDENISSFEKISLQESFKDRTFTSKRPKSVGVVIPNCGPNPVYLKSALKKPTQSAVIQVNDLASLETQVKGIVGKPSEVEYAIVDKTKKNRFASLPALNGTMLSNNNYIVEGEDKDPPVPPKKSLHKSDFNINRSRSSSPKKTFLERMQSLRKNAKSALQKAFSTERIYRPEKEERMEGQKGLQRSRSFIRGLAGSFRKRRRKTKGPPMAEVVPQTSLNSDWNDQSTGSNTEMHVLGQLLQLNLDGSQVVELTKPPTKPYGFFVARGRVRNSKGVFVSRMRDQETQKQLAGLLDIGDEILEIDGFHVKDADIIEVNRLMANKNTLLLTVLPYICRKDI